MQRKKRTPYALNIPFDEEGLIEAEAGIPYKVTYESEDYEDDDEEKFYFIVELRIKQIKLTIPFIFDSKEEAIEEGWNFD